ncbi:uncharacterized protein [Drosophila takahashii]|uniref:uncharacterized protein n=1 Tax=Drosophila takahashii TaxID=29030 RepID=UPI001CF7F98D|nr:uncharacterized protein LOC108068790 [Drosophila takahashii]
MLGTNCELVAQFPQRLRIDSIRKRQAPRTRSTCLSQEHRLWRQRNQVEIQQLAKVIGYCPEQIDGFLFELSLQNYNHLLNPKGCGWDACNVPLCFPDVCDRYMAIFDHHGNLRNPIQSKALDSLLPMLLDYLNDDRRDLPKYPFSHQANGLESSLESSDWIIHTFGSSVLPQRVKNTINNHDLQTVERMEPESESEKASLEDLRKKKKKKTFGRKSLFLNDELALAYAKPDEYVELLMKDLGRHRLKGSYVGPVGDLRTARIRILIRELIEKKGTNITYEDLRKALKKVDLEWKRTAKADYKREKKTAVEISKLYNAIVQRNSEQPIRPFVLGKVRDNYPKVPRASKLPRRYLADQVPILFHEPFDPKKHWTWQPRHPRQTRLNSKNKFSTSRIKRGSVKDQIDQYADRYSIHSTISDKYRSGERKSLEPQFGEPKK